MKSQNLQLLSREEYIEIYAKMEYLFCMEHELAVIILLKIL